MGIKELKILARSMRAHSSSFFGCLVRLFFIRRNAICVLRKCVVSIGHLKYPRVCVMHWRWWHGSSHQVRYNTTHGALPLHTSKCPSGPSVVLGCLFRPLADC